MINEINQKGHKVICMAGQKMTVFLITFNGFVKGSSINEVAAYWEGVKYFVTFSTRI